MDSDDHADPTTDHDHAGTTTDHDHAGTATDHDHADPATDHDHADPAHAGQLHHLELAVPDLDAALPWWEWLLDELGYDPKNDWDGGRSWRNGPSYIVLKAAAEPGAVERRAPGLDHVAFHAASREQVDRVTERVREHDAETLLYPDRHPYAGGYYALYCRGPGGITVELVGPDDG